MLYTGIAYRLDTREPSDVFVNGFAAQGSNQNVLSYVENNVPSAWVGVSKSCAVASQHTGLSVPSDFRYFIYRVNVIDAREVAEFVPSGHRLGAHEQEVLADGGIPAQDIHAVRVLNALAREWCSEWMTPAEWEAHKARFGR